MSELDRKVAGFGVLLSTHRQAAGLTQHELAEQAGISVGAVRSLEQGRTRFPRADSVERLVKVLGLRPPQADELKQAAWSGIMPGQSAELADEAGPAGDGGAPEPAPGQMPQTAGGELVSAAGLSALLRDLPAPPVRLSPPGQVSLDGGLNIIPRQLPGAVTHFAGRHSELASLTTLLGSPEAAGSPPAIGLITGTAGVGKTALMIQWAHEVAGQFPDGQLYVNLRGYDPDGPVPPPDALAGFLRALGGPGLDVPASQDERAALYRSLLAGRRILVLLDNAGSSEQARQLLPGAPGCTAVVTSRDSLPGLVALDGARRVDLDLLPLTDAIALLRTLIGERAAADPGATATLATYCSRLPLALRVAAELAVRYPSRPLPALVAELADLQRRLDLLRAGGEPRAGVRSVLSWSYQHLDEANARTFRLLGLHPGPGFDRYAAAALTGMAAAQAQQRLDELAQAHLVQVSAAGRYGMHDLLRAYARDLVPASDGDQHARRALGRLLDYYLHTSAAAMDALLPAERHRRPRLIMRAAREPVFTRREDARTWLDEERATLVAAATYAAANGWPSHTIHLASTLYRYLDTGGHQVEAVTIHSQALLAARKTGDRVAEAAALTGLGVTAWNQGRYQGATNHLEQALALYRETPDRLGEARALGNLGLVDWQLGRYQQASDHQREAVELFREAGDTLGEALALCSLGAVDERLGRFGQAAGHQERALTLFREIGYQYGEALALNSLGVVHTRLGQYEQAIGHEQEALGLFRQAGYHYGEARALNSLGAVHAQLGQYEQAISFQEQALALFRQTGDKSGEAEALNDLGVTCLPAGDLTQATAHLDAALALAEQVGDTYQQGRAHQGLASAHAAAGEAGQARHHANAAAGLFTQLGTPEAGQPAEMGA